MSRKVLIVVLMLAVSSPAFAQSANSASTAFRWLSPSKDAASLDRITTAFAEELKPDDPEKVKPYVAQSYKWLSRVGVSGTSALVLIGERKTQGDPYGPYFLAFNYDLERGEKKSLTASNEGFLAWKFMQLVRFDASSAPDIAFTHPSCMECESDHLLSSFRFNSTEAKWEVRAWPGAGAGVVIGSDYTVGTDEDSKDDCLFKFADFNGDGFDDLAVRCVTATRQGKVLGDSINLYTIQQGQPKIVEVTDPQQLARIRDQLCLNAKKSKLCPQNAQHPKS
jgi:hypothetical protein